MQNNNLEREFGWDDTIQYDSTKFVTLAPGDYWYTVESFERQRHTPNPKNQSKNPLPACNKAVLKLKIETAEGLAYATHNLFLHSRTEGLLSAFFGSIGQKKHDQPLQMNWSTVPGAVGVATFKNREYKGNLFNEVDRMIYSEDVDLSKVLNQRPGGVVAAQPAMPQQPAQPVPPQQPATGGFTPGQF